MHRLSLLNTSRESEARSVPVRPTVPHRATVPLRLSHQPPAPTPRAVSRRGWGITTFYRKEGEGQHVFNVCRRESMVITYVLTADGNCRAGSLTLTRVPNGGSMEAFCIKLTYPEKIGLLFVKFMSKDWKVCKD